MTKRLHHTASRGPGVLRAAALLALATLFAADASAGTVQTPECRRDLLVVESELSLGQARLAKLTDATRKEQCTVWRQHVDMARKAGATFRRCKTDTERRVMAADMDTQVNDFTTAIASTCKGL
jgi:hypothetical protein